MKKLSFAFLLIGLGIILLTGTSFVDGQHVNDPHPTVVAADTFPVPSGINNLLFYVQRTKNTNTIIYELNTDKSGMLVKDEPVHVYWKRYASDSSTAELSYIQKNYAYGVDAKIIDSVKMNYKINFVSYKHRDIYLIKSTVDNKYHTYTSINGKLSILNRVYVRIEGGTFWLPNIVYVELSGKDVTTGKTIKEKFAP